MVWSWGLVGLWVWVLCLGLSLSFVFGLHVLWLWFRLIRENYFWLGFGCWDGVAGWLGLPKL